MISEVPSCQHVRQADPTKKLGTNAIRNHIDHFRPVLRWIVVHTERSLAKGSINYLDDGVRNALDICVRRHDRRETFEYIVRETFIGTRFVFSDPRFVGGRTGMREVVSTP